MVCIFSCYEGLSKLRDLHELSSEAEREEISFFCLHFKNDTGVSMKKLCLLVSLGTFLFVLTVKASATC